MGLHERIKERRFLLLYGDKSSTLLETYVIRELPTTLDQNGGREAKREKGLAGSEAHRVHAGTISELDFG